MVAQRAITRLQDADDLASISGNDGKWVRLSSGAFVFATPTASDVGALASTSTLDSIAAAHATAADWSNNSHKITSLAPGVSSTDAANVSQLNPTHADTRFAPPIMGTIFSTTLTANQIYVVMVSVPYSTTLTGIVVDCTSATGNLLASLFDASGNQLAKSNSTAQVNSANQFVPFTSTFAAAFGAYYIGIQASSGSATYNQGIFAGRCTGISQGSFVVPSTISPPAVTTAVQMPYMSTY